MTEVTLKLKPRPAARRFVVADYHSRATFSASLAEVLASQVAPTAIEVEQAHPEAPVQLCVLIEGRPRAVEQRTAEVARLLGGAEVHPTAPPGWGQLPGPVTLKLTAPLSAVPALVEQASSHAAECGWQSRLAGSAGSGVLFLGAPDQVGTEALAALLAGLRSVAVGLGGHATVLRASASLKTSLDVWGPVPGIALMHRIKASFDPDRRLSPGRFVGGI